MTFNSMIPDLFIDYSPLQKPPGAPETFDKEQETPLNGKFSELMQNIFNQKLPYILALVEAQNNTIFYPFDGMFMHTVTLQNTLTNVPFLKVPIKRVLYFIINEHFNTFKFFTTLSIQELNQRYEKKWIYHIFNGIQEMNTKENVDNSSVREIFNKYIKKQAKVATCYFNGEGVTKNPEQAAYYLKCIENIGSSEAFLQLGACYEKGQGIDQNDGQALEYYNKANQQGNPEGIYRIAYRWEQHKGRQALERAIPLYIEAANRGHSKAHLRLGMYYAGKKETEEQCIKHYTEAMKAKNVSACLALGRIYSGKGQPYLEQAQFYFNKALELESDPLSEKSQIDSRTLSDLRQQILVAQYLKEHPNDGYGSKSGNRL